MRLATKERFWRESRLRPATFLAALLLTFEAAVALAGWYRVGPAAIGPTHLGVPYITALCCLFVAIAIAALAAQRTRVTVIVAGVTLILSAGMLVQHVMSWVPRMDDLAWHLGAARDVMRDALDSTKIVAMPVAPSAAAVLAIVSIALIAISTGRMSRSRLVLGSFGAFVATLGGFIGVSGALAGVPTQYILGNTATMSSGGAVGFLVIGLGVLAASVLTARRGEVYTGRIVPGIAATTVVISAILMWEALVEHDRRTLDAVVRHEALSIAAALERSVNDRARVVDRMVQRRTIAGGDSPATQSVSSSQVIRDFPGVTALSWLDSNGVISWQMAEAATGDEAVGKQFARSAAQRELLRHARTVGHAVISAPQMHTARSTTVLVAAPVAKNSGALDGYLVVEVIPERLIAEILPEDFDQLYGYALRDGGLMLSAHASHEGRADGAASATIGVVARGRPWQLSVYPANRTIAENSSLLPTTFLIAALICAALAARIVWAAQVAEEQSVKLAQTVDSLDAENEARRHAEVIRDDNAGLLQVQAAELAIQYRELQSSTDVLAAQRDELGHAHEFSAALVRSTVDAVVAFDNEGRVNTWNPAMSALTGWNHEDLGDAHVGTLLPFLGPGEERRIIREALAGRATTLNAMRAAHRQLGDTLYLDLTVTPMRAPDGTVLGGLLVAHDVTEQHRVADVILASKVAAEAASQAKSDFLARMSHELRTPLNAVIGFTNVILRNADNSLGKVQLTYLDRIRANGEHLLSLINTVLDLTKIESGTETVEMSPTSISILVRQTVSELEVNATTADLSLYVASPPTAYATTDPAKLKQVLINLVGNAMKFTPREGDIVVRVHADERTGQALRIDVEDTGIGVPADRLEAIFEAFEQADSQTAHVYGGTGLGLAISRKLCALMGHDLSAESTLGKGSRFTITFQPKPS
jgi:PAS domain S-box-containing protein